MLTLYDQMGGDATIARLVESFYRRVQAHPTLSQLFQEDIRGVKERQYAFLTQFFGGPDLYTERYGPPMLRARHLPHPISPERRDEWLSCMQGALDEVGLPDPVRDQVFAHLALTARHMVNQE